MADNDWAVFRLDFNGNEFLVEDHLSEERAHQLVAEFEAHKHHQHYWATRIPQPAVDYAGMLRESLAAGSALDASLRVLRHQGASAQQCIEAVCRVRGLTSHDARRAVLQSPAFADEGKS